MDVISGRTAPPQSALNPNAPMFVPLAYRTVEDFSKEWWALVQSSPWFRDYWLKECFTDPTQEIQNDPFFPDINDLALSDIDALFDDDHIQPNSKTQAGEEEEEEEKDLNRVLVSLGLLKWPKGRAVSESPRYIEKAPKFVNVKVSPRAIQQPR